METQNKLAGDENGFAITAIILLVLVIVTIVLVWFFP